MRLFSAFILSLLLSGAGDQPSEDPDDYPRDYFRSPLGIPLSLSGNFAEMRSNHFHGGLDIRTNAQTGYRVYAAGEGSIVRIAVSGGGYGNALYLQHPNGYMTVYGHLDRFEEPIASYVREMQYREQSFEVNLFPDAGRFRFAKGDPIAYSGNSGSSGGPHLHFEIRDAATSEPLNPLFFGLPVDDTTRPKIFRLYVYATTPTSSARVVGSSGETISNVWPGRPAAVDAVEHSPGSYSLAGGAQVLADGQVAFAIQSHDYHDRSQSRLGLYSIELHAGQQRLFRSAMERINFAQQRYINAHLDYRERSTNSRWVQRSHLLPGNRLNLYETARGGYLDVRPGDQIPMRYDVTDAHGNAASMEFRVVGSDLEPPAPPTRDGYFVAHDQAESFVMPGIIVRIPRGAVYEDVELSYSSAERPSGAFSRRHNLHSPSTPLHTSITISLEADRLPPRLQSKALLARVSGRQFISAGGAYDDGFVTSQTRSFGSYVIAVDTVGPSIRPGNISNGKNMAGVGSIRIEISDNLSGIAAYQGRIDGNWVLFEHDPKRSLIYYTFDDRVGPGQHVLDLHVEDGKRNVTRYSATFTR